MAGVERFELPTRADFWYGESADIFVVGDLNYTDVKNPHISVEAFLKMAGVERFELPTRGFGIRCSASWSYTPVVILKT